MAQWVRASAARTKDPNSIPVINMKKKESRINSYRLCSDLLLLLFDYAASTVPRGECLYHNFFFL